MIRKLLLLCFLSAPGCNSCKGEGGAAVSDEAESERGLRRNPVAEQRFQRRGQHFIFFDPDDDLSISPYAEGYREDDGGLRTEAPPQPTDKGEVKHSFSVGRPNAGWLIGGKALPQRTQELRVLKATQKRGWYFGSEELVTLLQHAAKEVWKRFPGSPLRVGSLSRQKGGAVNPPHASHQSGRDADLGLYCTDLDGIPADPPGFPRFRGNHVDASGLYIFDLRRNWALVETLLSSNKARVQWIFLDRPLKWMLLDYAARIRAPESAIAKAEEVIVRPNNSSPHDNHFHVRLFCTQRDLDWGCKDYGPEWGWVKEERKRYEQSIETLVNQIMGHDDAAVPPGPPLQPEDSKAIALPPPPGLPPQPPNKNRPKYERDDLSTKIEIQL